MLELDFVSQKLGLGLAAGKGIAHCHINFKSLQDKTLIILAPIFSFGGN
jgi:hypothetical protein